jgi:hypothetical protein
MRLVLSLSALVAATPFQEAPTKRLETVGSGTCGGSLLEVEFWCAKTGDSPLEGFVDELRLTRRVDGDSRASSTSSVLWTGLPHWYLGAIAEGRIGVIPSGEHGWVIASEFSDGFPGGITVWSGSGDLCDAHLGEGAGASTAPKADIDHIEYVRLENVVLGDKALLSGDLKSPSLFSWNGELRLIGTTSSIGFDPKNRDLGSNRVVWLSSFRDRAAMSTACKPRVPNHDGSDAPDSTPNTTKRDETRAPVSAVSARRISSGAFPSVIVGTDSVILACWDACSELIVDRKFPVRFMVSKDLVDWSESSELPLSLEVGPQFTVTGSEGSIVIVSRDAKGDKKFHVQGLSDGAWHDRKMEEIDSEDVAPNLPICARRIGARLLEIRWRTKQGEPRSALASY